MEAFAVNKYLFKKASKTKKPALNFILVQARNCPVMGFFVWLRLSKVEGLKLEKSIEDSLTIKNKEENSLI